MKKYRVTMLGKMIKEVYISAKNEKEAVSKLEKMYLDNEEFEFYFDDLRSLKFTCKEVESRRRDILTSKDLFLPRNYANEFIKLVIDKFHDCNKCITNNGILEIRLDKKDIKELENSYSIYQENKEIW